MSGLGRAWLGMAPGIRLLSVGVILLGAASFTAVAVLSPTTTTTTTTTTIWPTTTTTTSTKVTTESTGSTSTTLGSAEDGGDLFRLVACRGENEWVVALRASWTEEGKHRLQGAYQLLAEVLEHAPDLDEHQLKVRGSEECGIREGSDPVVIVGNHPHREGACAQVKSLEAPPIDVEDGWRIVQVDELDDLGPGPNEALGSGSEVCVQSGSPSPGAAGKGSGHKAEDGGGRP